jgi:hypothetical protein
MPSELRGRSSPDRPMRFAYADPPYPGQSYRLYGSHQDYAGEVDHAELVARLVADYPDGWALSTSASALPEVLALCPYSRGTDPKNPGRVEPDKSVRVLAWIKPGGAPFPVAVQFGWEPVILWGGRRRKYGRTGDYLIAQPERYTFRPKPAEHVPGAKPPAFCRWLFSCLGARPDDELVDLFPGSGAVRREWEAFQRAPALFDDGAGPGPVQEAFEAVG